jgi:hypothetical protein
VAIPRDSAGKQEEESTVFALARELIDPAELEDLGLQWQKAKARPSGTAVASKKRRKTSFDSR